MVRPRKVMSKLKEARNVDDESAMESLPSNILMDIISRLPIKAIIVMSSVSKSLLSIVSEPCFKKLHSSKAPTELFLRNPNQEDSSTLYITDPVFSADSSVLVDIKFSDVLDLQRVCARPKDSPKTKLSLVNSCNGLVCYCKSHDSYRFAVICNPITGEFVMISPPRGYWRVSYGFGFGNGRFKLLRLLTHYSFRTGVLRKVCEICTFGETESWRKVANTESYDEALSGSPVLYGGVLIWYTSGDNVIFDFDTEEFGRLVTPSGDANELLVHMSVLGGCLYATSCDKDCADVWVMKQYSEGSWVKAFSIKLPANAKYMNRGGFQPIEHVGNGEMLMFHDSRALVCYNPETRRVRRIGRLCRGYEAISIRPSLVSLKVMLGDVVKVNRVKSRSTHKDRVELAITPLWWFSSKMNRQHIRKVNDASDSVPFTNQSTELEEGAESPLQTEEPLVEELCETSRKRRGEFYAQEWLQ